MNQLVLAQSGPTMTSREIAELTLSTQDSGLSPKIHQALCRAGYRFTERDPLCPPAERTDLLRISSWLPRCYVHSVWL